MDTLSTRWSTIYAAFVRSPLIFTRTFCTARATAQEPMRIIAARLPIKQMRVRCAMQDTLSTRWSTTYAARARALPILTRALVTAILLLGAAACGGKDTLPTQPTRMPPAPATDIVGDYQLTFTASPSCSLPTQFMKRTYKANFRAWINYPDVAVDVSGGTFFQDWAVGFGGTRDGDTLHFTIVGMASDFYGYSLAELVDGTKWLTYDGTAVATIRGNNITGPFDGRISLLDEATRAILAECRATGHKIDFVR